MLNAIHPFQSYMVAGSAVIGLLMEVNVVTLVNYCQLLPRTICFCFLKVKRSVLTVLNVRLYRIEILFS